MIGRVHEDNLARVDAHRDERDRGRGVSADGLDEALTVLDAALGELVEREKGLVRVRGDEERVGKREVPLDRALEEGLLVKERIKLLWQLLPRNRPKARASAAAKDK